MQSHALKGGQSCISKELTKELQAVAASFVVCSCAVPPRRGHHALAAPHSSRMAVAVLTSSRRPSASYRRAVVSSMPGCGHQCVATRRPLRGGGRGREGEKCCNQLPAVHRPGPRRSWPAGLLPAPAPLVVQPQGLQLHPARVWQQQQRAVAAVLWQRAVEGAQRLVGGVEGRLGGQPRLQAHIVHCVGADGGREGMLAGSRTALPACAGGIFFAGPLSPACGAGSACGAGCRHSSICCARSHP